MKLVVRTAFILLPLMLVMGCGADKKPAGPPSQLMDPPKTRPIPGGGNKPAATTELLRPLLTANYQPA